MTTPTPGKTLSDYITSWIRTTIPVAWGALLTWLATLIPPLGDLLNSQAATSLNVIIAGALTIAWYSLWRKIETHLPPWATRIVLGSNTPPTYTDTTPQQPTNQQDPK